MCMCIHLCFLKLVYMQLLWHACKRQARGSVCVLCVCVLEFVFECGVWGFGSEHEDFPFNEMED